MKSSMLSFVVLFLVLSSVYSVADDSVGLISERVYAEEIMDKDGEPEGGILLGGDCTDYIDLSGQTLPITVNGSTYNSTNNYGPFAMDPPECWQGNWFEGAAGGKDVTYKWTAPYTGYFSFELCNSNYDSDILLFNFTCPDEPTYPDDFICGSDYGLCPQRPVLYNGGLQCINLTENQEVLVVVDGYWGTSGIYNLRIDDSTPPPPPFECQAGTIFPQPASIPVDQYSAWTSDVHAHYTVYDNLPDLTGSVCEIGFWGFDQYFSSGWYECTEESMTFKIVFYNDQGGLPGAELYSCMVTPTRTPLGITYFDWELNYYEAILDTCFDVNGGWISVAGASYGGTPGNCYFVWLDSPDGDNICYQWVSPSLLDRRTSMSMCFGGTVTSIDNPEIDLLPTSISVSQNYPNPFNESSIISFTLNEPRKVNLTIYDLLGQKIETLLDEYRQPGVHTVNVDASGLSSGVYFYRLQAGDAVETKRMVLLK